MKLTKLSLGLAAGALVLGAAAVAVTPAAVQAFSGAAAHAVLDVPALQGTPGPSTGPGPGIPHRGPQPLIEAAASVTGLSNQEVLTQLQNGQSLAQIAASKGKTADDVIQAARTLLQTRLKQAVTDGRLTQAQADTDLQEFDSSAQQIVNATTLGQDFGPRGDGGFGHGGPRFGHEGGSLVAAAASVTGLTTQEVLTQLQSGQSLAQIAASKGKTADDVIQAARTTLQTLLKQAVTDGRLTQAQADAKLQQFDSTAPAAVASTTPWQGLGPRGDGGFGHGGPGFGHEGGSLVAATASVTGLTAQEVLTLRQSGQSLAQIAESKGKTADDVIQAARTTLQTLLKQAVTDGRLTQARADEELQEFDARAQQMVSATDLGGPSGGPRFNNPANPIVPTPTGGSSA